MISKKTMPAAYPHNSYQTPMQQVEEDEDNYDDETGTILLEEDYQPDYEPEEEEILEYAEYLGMDLVKDKEFFYIAREGLKTQLPEPWLPMRNSKGEIFYINSRTKEKTFLHPCDAFYKSMFQREKAKKVASSQLGNTSNSFSASKSNKFGSSNLNSTTSTVGGGVSSLTRSTSKHPQADLKILPGKVLLPATKVLPGVGAAMTSTTASAAAAAANQFYNESFVLDESEDNYDDNGLLGSNMDSSKPKVKTDVSDVMNDDEIAEELIFFENYLKKQLSQTEAEHEKVFARSKQEFKHTTELDQLKRKNRLEEAEDDLKREVQSRARIINVRKGAVREQVAVDTERAHGVDVAELKRDFEQSQSEADAVQRREFDAKIKRINEEYERKFEEWIEKRQEAVRRKEEYARTHAEEIEAKKQAVIKKFAEKKEPALVKEFELKRIAEENVLEQELQSNQEDVLKEMREEIVAVQNMLGGSEKDIERRQMQMRELSLKKLELQRALLQSGISDRLRTFQQEQNARLTHDLKTQERVFLENNLPDKMNEAQTKHLEEIAKIQRIFEADCEAIKSSYHLKVQHDQVEAMRKQNEIRESHASKENMNGNSSNSNKNNLLNLNVNGRPVLPEQEQHTMQILEDLQLSLHLKRKDLLIEKQQRKNLENETSRALLLKDLMDSHSDNKEEFLLERSQMKSDLLDSYNKMLSSSSQSANSFSQSHNLHHQNRNQNSNTRLHNHRGGQKLEMKHLNQQQESLEQQQQQSSIGINGADGMSSFGNINQLQQQQQYQYQQQQQSHIIIEDREGDDDEQSSDNNRGNQQHASNMRHSSSDKKYQPGSVLMHNLQRISIANAFAGTNVPPPKLQLQQNNKGLDSDRDLSQLTPQQQQQQMNPLKSNRVIFPDDDSDEEFQDSFTQDQLAQHSHNQHHQQHRKNSGASYSASGSLTASNNNNNYNNHQSNNQYSNNPLNSFAASGINSNIFGSGNNNSRQAMHRSDLSVRRSRKGSHQKQPDQIDPYNVKVKYQQQQLQQQSFQSKNRDNQRNHGKHQQLQQQYNDTGIIGATESDFDQLQNQNIDGEGQGDYAENNVALGREEQEQQQYFEGDNAIDDEKANQINNNNNNNQSNPLFEFLDDEWSHVDGLKDELRFDKILVKKAFEYLNSEKIKLRQLMDMVALDGAAAAAASASVLHPLTSSRIPRMKARLQELASDFNLDVQTTRANQEILQQREDALLDIEDILEKGEFSQEELSFAIDVYTKKVLPYSTLKLTQQIREQQMKRQNYSSGATNNQQVELDELLAFTFDVSNQLGDISTNLILGGSSGYYSMQMRAEQVKQAHLFQIEKREIQLLDGQRMMEEISGFSQMHHTTNKAIQNFPNNSSFTEAQQLDLIFDDHAKWLKNVKHSLNRNLMQSRIAKQPMTANGTNQAESKRGTRFAEAVQAQDSLNNKMEAVRQLTRRIQCMNVLLA